MTSDLKTPPGHCCLAITVLVVCTSEGLPSCKQRGTRAVRGDQQSKFVMKSLEFLGRLIVMSFESPQSGGGGHLLRSSVIKTNTSYFIARVWKRNEHDAKHGSKKARQRNTSDSEQQIQERTPLIFLSVLSYPG